jgi:acyl-CoA thioesterase I
MMRADENTYLAPLVAELKQQWPANRAITVACHGHSVPSGYFHTPVVDTFNAYPHLLHRG